MTEEILEKISVVTAKAQEDGDFMDRLTAITSAQELQQLCNEIGIDTSRDEAEEGLGILRNSLAEAAVYELSNEELERIAAGAFGGVVPVKS